MRNLVFIFLFFSFPGFSQNILPLYEKRENGELLLQRIDSIPKDIKKKFDTVSFISEKGICYGNLSKFRLVQEKECCTKPDPKFLLAIIKLKAKNCPGR